MSDTEIAVPAAAAEPLENLILTLRVQRVLLRAIDLSALLA